MKTTTRTTDLSSLSPILAAACEAYEAAKKEAREALREDADCFDAEAVFASQERACAAVAREREALEEVEALRVAIRAICRRLRKGRAAA